MIRIKKCETTGFEPGKSRPGFLYVTLNCWPCVAFRACHSSGTPFSLTHTHTYTHKCVHTYLWSYSLTPSRCQHGHASHWTLSSTDWHFKRTRQLHRKGLNRKKRKKKTRIGSHDEARQSIVAVRHTLEYQDHAVETSHFVIGAPRHDMVLSHQVVLHVWITQAEYKMSN